MKKSNKLLLVGFLMVVATISALHLTLYARYKNGDYTVQRYEDRLRGYPMQSFDNITHVTLRNLPAASVEFGDKAAVQKGKEDFVHFAQNGDSLVISGRENNDEPDGRRRILISLPYNARITAIQSMLHFEANAQIRSNSPEFDLQQSHVVFFPRTEIVQLGHVKFTANDQSHVSFGSFTKLDHLEARLKNSYLEFSEGDADQLTIVTDSVSRLSLQAKHLVKAKITYTANKP